MFGRFFWSLTFYSQTKHGSEVMKKSNPFVVQNRRLISGILLALAPAFAVSAGQGIEVSQGSSLLYFDDESWSGSWNYLCLNNNCMPGELINGRWQRDVSEMVTEGSSYNIQLKIQDNAHGQFISPEYAVQASAGSGGVQPPENVEPSLLLGVSDSSLEAGDSFTVTANASDEDGEITSVAFYLSAPGQAEVLAATVTSAPYRYVQNDTVAGSYQVRVVATDNADATVEDSVTVNVSAIPGENTPPQVSISASTDGLAAGDSVTINVSASDADGQVSVVTLYLTEPGAAETALASLNVAPYQWQVDELVAGAYNLRVVAEDDQAATSESQQQFTVAEADVVAPPAGDYGVEVIDNSTALYWTLNQDGWGGGDYYSCKNGEQDCYPASLVNGRWERQHNNMVVGQSYSAQLKVPGLGADQNPSWVFTWDGDGTTSGDGDNGGDNGEDGGTVGNKDPQVVAPSVPEILPALDYGYTEASGNFLVGGLGNGDDKFGFTLYTFAPDVAGSGNSNCVDCAAWPALTVSDEAAIVRPSRLLGELGTINLPNGDLQVTYQGKPLYFRAADQLPGETAGASDAWPLAIVETSPVPEELYQRALKTPTNMTAPSNGFGFNISGNQVSWEFGSVLGGVSAPEVSFHCTVDQMVFHDVNIVGGQASIPADCAQASTYWYFFEYAMNNPGAGSYAMNNSYDFDPDSARRYTALYINDGTRIDLSSREVFKDVGANWMRFRHPRAYDGVTEAIRDASHNSSRLADLARYSIEAIETTAQDGSVNLVLDLNMPISYTGSEQGLVRLEGLQNGAGDAKLPTWLYNFEPSNNQTTYTQGGWSYGQNISFEMTGVVGLIGAQTYNTFQYYTIGMGFHSPIGDPRLSLVGKGGTHMVFNIKNYGGEFKNGHVGAGIHDMIMEKGAIFTQHLTTLNSPSEVDDFLWGHHLFHGVKLQQSTNQDPSQDNLGSNPGDTGIGNELPEIKAGGPVACGDCHYRDGRGSNVLETPKGLRIAPPTFGVGLLQYIDGREAGFTWNGTVPTVRQQIKNALVADHGIDPSDPEQITPEDLELISKYTEYLTIPARSPGVYDKPGVTEGDKLFHEVGCVSCHTPIQKTSDQAPEAFRNLVIRPYTDMKRHKVAGGTYRTAPLWGLGRNIDLLENNNKLVNGEIDIGIALYDGSDEEQKAAHHMRERALLFLHDGRATTLHDAIIMHQAEGSEAAANSAVAAYSALSEAEQQQVIQFLRSL